ncbi:T3SS-associated acyl carrier protein BapB [Burkholderia oklahomensis]|uniref:Phosphopantetheine attachment site family protein n=1 Tax=Burkholderia oklahomensis TaxID=342113 RepID=A0AAI8BAI7_9BURK|nr:T3SS-associated acyl carrier protein BapB [Burkholderia oklahomensis]AIO68556.1 phosphopantetheine attachment site family protein [Burkholderia oklahomensis]AJX34283.1 phosphopantetheine attachment site family protein [Burkholderia oklahomensis C6786]AOI38823.1 BapB protein [Burkholderia oklahomensis EO147]AOI48521.1 BapB protein [Burkholderia oklahomensis C6786]KUY48196.1 BapB protein [Burkholderia oklahomensis C6786]
MTADSCPNDAAALAAAKTLFAGMLGVPEAEIAPEQRLLDDLAMDSLELIELAMALDEGWNIELDRARLADVATVADVAALIGAAAGPDGTGEA